MGNSFFKKIARIIKSSMVDFWKDECYPKSSLLTLYTLQSLVPFLAFLMGLARGFGFDEYLKSLIETIFVRQKEVMNYAIQISYTLLEHLKGGVIAGVGLLFLFWTIITLLGYIESVLNEIWKVKTPRTFLRKFTDYLAIIIICPIILIVSSSVTVYLKSLHIAGTSLYDTLGFFVAILVRISPIVLNWILFLFLYFFIPNTKLKIWPRVFSALLAGCVFQLWQLVYINAQIYIFSYNAVYGTVAAIPLFLIWLQTSWMIALGGAELAAHIEYDFSLITGASAVGKFQKINKHQLAFLILYQCLRPFYMGNTTPPTDFQISKILQIPISVTQKMLDILTNGKVLTTVSLKGGVVGYHPLVNPSYFTIKDICDIVDTAKDFEVLAESSDPLPQITEFLNKLSLTVEKSKDNIKLSELFHT